MPLFVSENELAQYQRRYLWFVIAIVLAFLVFSGRLYCVQVSHGEEYEALSRSNFVSTRRDVALRGMIFDRTGRLLADNRASFNLYFTPAFCKTQAFETTLGRLIQYMGLSDREIEVVREAYEGTKKLDRFLPVLVRRDMSWPELASVEQNLSLLDGVDVRSETRRAYPEGRLAAHLIGYVGEIGPAELGRLKSEGYVQGDTIGKAGLERNFETVLRGKNGQIHVVVDARNQRVADSVAREILSSQEKVAPAVPGHNLILSIDARLQELAEKRFPGIEGAAVAVDTRTGFVLAMVSKPAFDPNLVSGRLTLDGWSELVRDPDRPLLNRAIQQHFPPGSTFKPFTGLAALESGALDENTPQTCGGGFRFGDHLFRCWRAAGHGSLSMHRAIVQSCDVFFYRAGQRAGLDAIAEVSRSFGFGVVTGIDPGQEVPGIMPDTEWYRKNTKTGFLPGFTISDSIGQGDVNVTPLQLALGYAAIANGGQLMVPQVVQRMESFDGQEVSQFTPQVRNRVKATPEHLKVMADALAGVVNEPGGTAYYRRPKGVSFQVAGKTGTAQVVKQGDDRGKDLPYDFRDHAWFVGFGPVDDPQIAVAVVNEHGGHGSSGAAPLVMEMISFYLEQIEPPTTNAQVP